MPTIQHDAVIFEPTPEDRVAAEHVAELITPASMGSLAGTTATAGPDPDGTVFEFVVQLLPVRSPTSPPAARSPTHRRLKRVYRQRTRRRCSGCRASSLTA